ncbi:MAG: DUF4160 domain-containing protein [Coriobacteriales bacterium]|nr:DUF4160 domain-containing protein [Coriobacteriales bacterium]
MSPKYGRFLQYGIFFFSNEVDEPPHVHVSLPGTPNSSSKFWLDATSVRLAHNDARIPSHDLTRIERYLNENVADILEFWEAFFKGGGNDPR